MNYSFYIDRKQTCWEREYFTVDAENQEQAKIEAIKQYNGEVFIDPDMYETLDDTSNNMTVEENGGFSTMELYTETGELITENGKGILYEETH